MFPPHIQELAVQVISAYRRRGWKIATAESCTGGLISAALTDVAGSSEVFDRGYVTYSNAAKAEALGVSSATLEKFGAVSAEVAEAMAAGAISAANVEAAVAVTGIAGPAGATEGKQIGLVYIGFATKDGIRFHERCQFDGDRESVRLQSVREALELLLSFANEDED